MFLEPIFNQVSTPEFRNDVSLLSWVTKHTQHDINMDLTLKGRASVFKDTGLDVQDHSVEANLFLQKRSREYTDAADVRKHKTAETAEVKSED